jgi:hypothetical protein
MESKGNWVSRRDFLTAEVRRVISGFVSDVFGEHPTRSTGNNRLIDLPSPSGRDRQGDIACLT